MNETPHILSLGAGVQSSVMALMAAAGEIKPMPMCAIFADTQAEPEGVYRWLDWLEKQLPFPVHRVTFGSLAEKALILKTSKGGKTYTQHAIPAFIIDDAGRIGLAMRQCTTAAKLVVIHREIRRLIGRKRDAKCIQWIGISRDEIMRAKPSRKQYIENRYPLIDARITRADCLRWMKDQGLPTPPRSACVFCPYHSNKEWSRLKMDEPKEFARAVEWESKFQTVMSQVSGFRGTPFLHRSCQPLATVDFTEPEQTPDLFNNECEGMCGV